MEIAITTIRWLLDMLMVAHAAEVRRRKAEKIKQAAVLAGLVAAYILVIFVASRQLKAT